MEFVATQPIAESSVAHRRHRSFRSSFIRLWGRPFARIALCGLWCARLRCQQPSHFCSSRRFPSLPTTAQRWWIRPCASCARGSSRRQPSLCAPGRFAYVVPYYGRLGCDQRIRPASPGKCAQRGGVARRPARRQQDQPLRRRQRGPTARAPTYHHRCSLKS